MSAPVFVGDPQPWMTDALCLQFDPETWFPEKGGTARVAKRICSRRDVSAACLIFALACEGDGWDRYGVYGGMTAIQRRRIARGPLAGVA